MVLRRRILDVHDRGHLCEIADLASTSADVCYCIADVDLALFCRSGTLIFFRLTTFLVLFQLLQRLGKSLLLICILPVCGFWWHHSSRLLRGTHESFGDLG